MQGSTGTTQNGASQISDDFYIRQIKFTLLTLCTIAVPCILMITALIYRQESHLASLLPLDYTNAPIAGAYFVTNETGTKIVYPATLKIKDIPENKKFKANVYFAKDGSAIIYDSLEYTGSGLDTIWHSNGKWYAILGDEIIEKNDVQKSFCDSPTDCGYPPVTLMQVK